MKNVLPLGMAGLIFASSLVAGCSTSKNIAKKIYNPDKEVERFFPREDFILRRYESKVPSLESPRWLSFNKDHNFTSSKMKVLDPKEGILYEAYDVVGEEINSEPKKLEILKATFIQSGEVNYFIRNEFVDKPLKKLFNRWDFYYNCNKGLENCFK